MTIFQVFAKINVRDRPSQELRQIEGDAQVIVTSTCQPIDIY